MIVFKNYFKIVKKFLPVIIMYTVIFTVFAVANSNSNTSEVFSSAESNVAVINYDEESKLTETFINYVKDNAKIVDTGTNDEELRDSLFYREVDYVMLIPNNFSNQYLSDSSVQIETMKIPESYSSTYAEMLFNRFWNVAKIYSEAGMNEEKIADIILNDLEDKVEVAMLESNQNDLQKVNYFYNFTNYTILAVSIFVVGMLMTIFNDSNIKKRNVVSAVSYKKFNRQLFLGNACLTLLIWSAYVILSIILYGTKIMFTTNGLLTILNSLVFSIAALSIGFLVGNLVKSKEAQNGIVNVIALGSSFISGAFVPQYMLRRFCINYGKILPILLVYKE